MTSSHMSLTQDLKAHDWAIDQLAPILLSAGHSVKCQSKVAPNEGKGQGGSRNCRTSATQLVLVSWSSTHFSITHDHHGRSTSNPQTNDPLPPESFDKHLEIAARAKVTKHLFHYEGSLEYVYNKFPEQIFSLSFIMKGFLIEGRGGCFFISSRLPRRREGDRVRDSRLEPEA